MSVVISLLLPSGHPEFTSQPDEISQAATVAEVVQHFITAMDSLNLNQREIDEVQPLISDLLHRYVTFERGKV